MNISNKLAIKFIPMGNDQIILEILNQSDKIRNTTYGITSVLKYYATNGVVIVSDGMPAYSYSAQRQIFYIKGRSDKYKSRTIGLFDKERLTDAFDALDEFAKNGCVMELKK